MLRKAGIVGSLLACLTACRGPAPNGEVRVLTDRTQAHLTPLFAAFERATGTRVRAVYLDAGLVARLQSRPVEADVVITRDVDVIELAKQKGLLRRLSSPVLKATLPRSFIDPGDHYFSDSFRARAIFYSKARVRPSELSTYADLASPRWRGRICLRSGYHDYNVSLFAQMYAGWGPDPTRRFLEGLHANLARTPSGNDREQVRAIFRGECDVAIANSYYMGIMLVTPEQRAWGEATGVFFPDQGDLGTFVLASGLGLTRASRNVEAARGLLEFMVRPDVQAMIAHMTFAYPTAPFHGSLPETTRGLGAGQPGITDGTFKVRHMPPFTITIGRDAVIETLDELRFDRPR